MGAAFSFAAGLLFPVVSPAPREDRLDDRHWSAITPGARRLR